MEQIRIIKTVIISKLTTIEIHVLIGDFTWVETIVLQPESVRVDIPMRKLMDVAGVLNWTDLIGATVNYDKTTNRISNINDPTIYYTITKTAIETG